VATDSPRIADLRRRVQADPASIAFAQLAEECRRAGAADEAITISRAGLSHHPGYLSARVTLGRALIELGHLDEAEVELSTVVHAAPTNLPAIRGLAEILQQRGDLVQALAYYRQALQLARFDPDLEDSVSRLSQAVAPAAATTPPGAVRVEDLFDFDSLLRQLGDTQPISEPAPATAAAVPSVIDAVDLELHSSDALADVERHLRELAAQRSAEEKIARVQLTNRRQSAVVSELEDWLTAIVNDRPDLDQA
jgi:tetratricopeptide (TPR) repeat protein